MYVPQPDGTNRIIWKFNGGLHLSDHKALSNGVPVRQAPIPKRLILPLQPPIGTVAQTLVQVGDQVLKGELIATSPGELGTAICAPTSGTVLAIGPHPVPHPSNLSAPCITMAADGLDTWTKLPAPLPHYQVHNPQELIARVRWAGIVGLGGAAFPSSAKLTYAIASQIKLLIINGIECEPYITCDDMLMRMQPGKIVDGVRILLHILGVKDCLIGIEDNKPEATAALYAALQVPDLQDWVKVVTVPTLYPSGGERQLIKLLTGQEVPSGGLPANVGVVCFNVGTVAAIADAVLAGRPLISRLVTVTGQGVKNPCNMDVLIGTPIGNVIAEAGGYMPTVRRLIVGGPMMGYAVSTDVVPVTKATNCLLVSEQAAVPDATTIYPCIRCGECARVCPANLLPQQLYWHGRAKNLEQAQALHIFDCIECGCCSYVCPSHLPLVQYYRATKAAIREQTTERGKSNLAKQRYEARQARLKRQEELRQERLRQRQANLKTTDAATIEAAMRRVAAKKRAATQDE